MPILVPNVDAQTFAPGGAAYLSDAAKSRQTYNMPRLDAYPNLHIMSNPVEAIIDHFRVYKANPPHNEIFPPTIFNVWDIGERFPVLITGDIIPVAESDLDPDSLRPEHNNRVYSPRLQQPSTVRDDNWTLVALNCQGLRLEARRGRITDRVVLATDLLELPADWVRPTGGSYDGGELYVLNDTHLAAFTFYACFILWRPHPDIRPKWQTWADSLSHPWQYQDLWAARPYVRTPSPIPNTAEIELPIGGGWYGSNDDEDD